MKQFLLFMTLCLIPVMSFAQEKDSDGRVVTQNGNQYKVTFNATSDNGGTISETWYGSIVNGKREGTWNFVGNYNKYEISSGIFRTGTVTMTRTYKNGVPNGKYVLKHDLQLMNGGYNIFTDNWIYKAPSDYNEYISGAYINGKPTGTWNINYEGLEKLTLTFKNGVMDGAFSITDVIRGLTTKGSFKNGYVLTMQEMLGVDWGYETDYAGKDPSTIQPQETVSLANMITMWELYATGMNICNEYMTNYPVNSSDERAPEITYIFSDADKYRKLFGNVPESVVKSMEQESRWKDELRFQEKDASLKVKLDSLISQYISTIDTVFCKFLEANDLMDYYTKDYVIPTISLQYPEFKIHVDAQEERKEINGGGPSSSFLWYFESPTDSIHTFKYQYGKICEPLLEQVYKHHGTDNDSTRYYIHKYYLPHSTLRRGEKEVDLREWDAYLSHLDEVYKRENLTLTERDIQIYLILKYVKYGTPDAFGDASYSLISKDASSVKYEDVLEFVLKYSDADGNRTYDNIRMGYNVRYGSTVSKILEVYKDTKKFKKLLESVPFYATIKSDM